MEKEEIAPTLSSVLLTVTIVVKQSDFGLVGGTCFPHVTAAEKAMSCHWLRKISNLRRKCASTDRASRCAPQAELLKVLRR